MTRFHSTASLFVILLALLSSSTVAYSGTIQIGLLQSSDTGVPGGTVTFDAFLANTSSTTIWLNGDSFTTSSSNLTVNDNPFLTNAPQLLGGGAVTQPFVIFDVFIAPGTPSGTYTLNNFTILGGLTNSDFNPVGSTNFTVNVISPVPEPGTFLLVGSGLFAIGMRYCLTKLW